LRILQISNNNLHKFWVSHRVAGFLLVISARCLWQQFIHLCSHTAWDSQFPCLSSPSQCLKSSFLLLFFGLIFKMKVELCEILIFIVLLFPLNEESFVTLPYYKNSFPRSLTLSWYISAKLIEITISLVACNSCTF